MGPVSVSETSLTALDVVKPVRAPDMPLCGNAAVKADPIG